MKFISEQQINSLFSYQEFIPFLADFFSNNIESPKRTHLSIGDNTLLLMPAWNNKYCGVKVATVFPSNRNIGKPTIHAVYTLFDAENGVPIVQLDGKTITNKRTAAASALASSYLSKKESENLLMVGNGALCPELIKAHASVRPIKNIKIWGRNPQNIKKIIRENNWDQLNIGSSSDINHDCKNADIISCATSTINPVIFGKDIKPGTHIDLVGSYKPNMRETDDDLIIKSKIYIDNESAKQESGDIFIPLKNGIIKASVINGTLKELVSGIIKGRSNLKEITLFKSVGFALEDLAIAVYIFQKGAN